MNRLQDIYVMIRNTSHRYTLMHNDIDVIDLEFENGHISKIDHTYNVQHIPYNTKDSYNRVQATRLDNWFARRDMPEERILLPNQIRPSSIEKSLALSLHDSYWLRPYNECIGWADVNKFENKFTKMRHPDYATNGQLPKTWIIEQGWRYLVKGANAAWTHQPENELIGSELCRLLGIRHVSYNICEHGGERFSICPCTLGVNDDYITAFDIIGEFKQLHPNESDIGCYFSELARHGISYQKPISDMCLVDVLLRNEDRHWSNFGIIRDARTLRWKATLPLFDFGNSLWFKSEATLLEPISKFSGYRLTDDLKFVQRITDSQRRTIETLPQLVNNILKDSRLSEYHKQDLYQALNRRTANILSRL